MKNLGCRPGGLVNLIQSVVIISFFLVSFIEFGDADAQGQDSTNATSTLMEKGFALQVSGQYNESIGYFDKVLAIDPNNVVALDNKRLAIENLG
jgi:tetratricopeptide (TPR) repeat protein